MVPDIKLLDKKRFEAFIDAIFAIVITFLVLEFKVPHLEMSSTEALKECLLDMLPLFLCYILSFLTIVSVWLDHHFLFKAIGQMDGKFALLNFLFVLSASALPFTTGFAGEYIHNSFAVAFFCTSILIMNIVFALLFSYASARNMFEKENMPNYKTSVAIGSVGIGLEAASIGLAFVNIPLAMSLICIVVVLHIIKRL